MSVPQPIQLKHDRIYVNLPVDDLSAQREFYLALGFRQNLQFSDENTVSFEVTEHIVLMLLEREKFNSFHDRESVPAQGPREVLNALDVGSRKDVNELIRRVRQAGGKVTREPEEQGPMYGAAFDDLEGHGWELFWMDPTAL